MPAEQSIAASAVPARTSLMLQGPDGRRPRLLLAEDSDPVRIVTAAMLKAMGCDVDAVAHGEEAVRCASANPFDVIVLDIEMPIMDGITAARSIRKLGGRIKRTPIMALSAFLADAMQSASWSDTFDIALPKPANRNELHAAVKAALDRTALSNPACWSEAEPVISRDQLKALMRGLSPDVWRELAAIACRDIEDCVARIARLVNGEEAGSRTVYAQKLKALGRTFAAPRLALVGRRLEDAKAGEDVAQLLRLLAVTSDATIAGLRNS